MSNKQIHSNRHIKTHIYYIIRAEHNTYHANKRVKKNCIYVQRKDPSSVEKIEMPFLKHIQIKHTNTEILQNS